MSLQKFVLSEIEIKLLYCRLQNVCSYWINHNKKHDRTFYQNWYQCNKCKLNYICESCKVECHKDHSLREASCYARPESEIYCYCASAACAHSYKNPLVVSPQQKNIFLLSYWSSLCNRLQAPLFVDHSFHEEYLPILDRVLVMECNIRLPVALTSIITEYYGSGHQSHANSAYVMPEFTPLVKKDWRRYKPRLVKQLEHRQTEQAENASAMMNLRISKKGGLPFLKREEDWPSCFVCHRPLFFFVQYRLSDMPACIASRLAIHDIQTEMLQVFVCENSSNISEYDIAYDRDTHCLTDAETQWIRIVQVPLEVEERVEKQEQEQMLALYKEQVRSSSFLYEYETYCNKDKKELTLECVPLSSFVAFQDCPHPHLWSSNNHNIVLGRAEMEFLNNEQREEDREEKEKTLQFSTIETWKLGGFPVLYYNDDVEVPRTCTEKNCVAMRFIMAIPMSDYVLNIYQCGIHRENFLGCC